MLRVNKEIEDLKTKLSTHSEEIVKELKKKIDELKDKLAESQKEKNKHLDEKLKIQEIIDQQMEQIEYYSNKANKLEDEKSLRKQIEESVKENLRTKEEEIRVLKLAQIESIIRSFKVKFINIEEAKVDQEILVDGTVQTCQSLENDKEFFLRVTYKSNKDKNIKSFKVEAD